MHGECSRTCVFNGVFFFALSHFNLRSPTIPFLLSISIVDTLIVEYLTMVVSAVVGRSQWVAAVSICFSFILRCCFFPHRICSPLLCSAVYTSCHFLVRGHTAARFILLSSPPCPSSPRLTSRRPVLQQRFAIVHAGLRWGGGVRSGQRCRIVVLLHFSFRVVCLSLFFSLAGRVLVGGFHLVVH